ncbi:PASTA domain-containing protein [Sphaerisporangium corydalis]|uniref:PASTA domain-containing protein n=1 Tax=Sphaerisporangium corydalis TaxID=1441875 RepID=A0ABV9ECR2_9ACTN|nr:PASTA domain-containing protein [Sphaerisporangium corydalis]
MARAKTVNLVGPVIVVLLIVGGCSKLIESVFGGDDPAQAAQPAGPVYVPDLRKTTLVDAENKTEALGVDLSADGIGSSSYCPDETDCVIYRMSPKPGTVVKAGAEVAVKFVTREEWAWYRKHRKMPNVVGWSETKADGLFDVVDSTVDSASKESTRVAVGKDVVLAQSPKPGRPLRIGQKIKLVIGYNFGMSSGTGDLPNGNLNPPNGRGESRFCSHRWWC